MVASTQEWSRLNPPNPLHNVWDGSFLPKRPVSAVVIIITRLAPQDPAEMRLADDDIVIAALARI